MSLTCHTDSRHVASVERYFYNLPIIRLLTMTLPVGLHCHWGQGSQGSVILALTQSSPSRTFFPSLKLSSTEVLRLMLKCLCEYVTASLCLGICVWMWTPCGPTVFPGNLCHLLVSWAAAHSVAVYRLLCCPHRVGFTRLWFRHSLSRSKILVAFPICRSVILVNNTLCDWLTVQNMCCMSVCIAGLVSV